jgi:hypothetical protein
MTVGTSFYHVVVPVEKTNLIGNPSFEVGDIGWEGTANINTAGSVVFGTAASAQAFGAWSARLTGATGTFGIRSPIGLTSPLIRVGTSYTASAYVRVTSDTGVGGSVQIPPAQRVGVGSTWTRITAGTTAAGADSNWAIRVYHFGASTGTLWVDGVQVEAGSVTTYVDGDQEGCQWLGLPHQSQSIRSGQTRAGGSVIPLSALGLRTETHVGVGMPPMVNVSLPRAILDGAEYQRTRADVREFVLTATLVGTTTADLHRTRRRIIDALKIDRTFPPAPTRFIYTGAGEDVEIDAIYNGGLEITDMQVINDNVAARFVAFDPMWYSSLDEGTALAAFRDIGDLSSIAYRDPNGQWGTMGRGNTGTTVQQAGVLVTAIYTINTELPGTVFVGGNFGTAGGTVSRGIAYYAGDSWGTLGGTVNGSVFALKWTPNLGTLIIGGAFSEIRGTAVVGGIGYYVRSSGLFGTLGGTIRDGYAPGGAAGTIYALNFGPSGQLLIGGAFSTVAGTLARGIAQWTSNNAYGTINGGTLGNTTDLSVRVQNIQLAQSNNIVVVGSWGTTNGTVESGHAAVYNFNSEQWGTIAPPLITGVEATEVLQAALDNQGRLYMLAKNASNAVGGFSGVSNRQIFEATPSASPLFLGTFSFQNKVSVLRNNDIAFTAIGGFQPIVTARSLLQVQYYPWSRWINDEWGPLGFAYWNGYTLLPSDLIGLFQNRLVFDVQEDRQGTLYAAGEFRTAVAPALGVSGSAAFVAPIVNQSMAESYPVVYMRNNAVGTTTRIYQLLNDTTNDKLYFDLELAPNEELTINMTPGRRSITSSFRGNMISSLLTGSNLATWRLAPGTNWVSFLGNNSNLQTNIYWRPRHWAIDGGAEPTI